MRTGLLRDDLYQRFFLADEIVGRHSADMASERFPKLEIRHLISDAG